ncbi:glycosyltransferase family 2 protein [Pelomonas sp. CA6]|uniref:glycosyltransferase family 2 protein n=1 Tax=Pelomonas sp. CA6 TaxID=2907999 RepID=UPI001F4C1053|nr:glycosyltransferase family 2 protein [Pelomonas sp. CA6]MCH7344990.1 glycosyltransferase family 2 protein [Pelomonas sp. CA6]
MQITTLIPAYKPAYLAELLACLRHQTLKPARVLVSDDSPDQAFVAALSQEPLKSLVADLHIEVFPGPRRGGYNNFRQLLWRFRQQPTELFHFLLDDDVIYPAFYARHAMAHGSGEPLCVVSRRWTALEGGLPVRDLPVPAAVDQHPQRLLALDATLLFRHTAGSSANWLGELSNATFRAEAAESLDQARLAGLSYAGLEDLGAFLVNSLKRPLGYINEHLGFFRTSSQQNSANPMGRPLKLAHLAYVALTLAGRDVGVLSADECAQNLARLCPLIAQRYGGEADMAALCETMPALARHEAAAEQQFRALWADYSGASHMPPVPLV